MNIKVFDNFLEDLDRDYIQSYLNENKWVLQISDQHKSIGLDFLMMNILINLFNLYPNIFATCLIKFAPLIYNKEKNWQ